MKIPPKSRAVYAKPSTMSSKLGVRLPARADTGLKRCYVALSVAVGGISIEQTV
jgi:hypothetical protein